MKEPYTICHITIGHNPLDDRIFYKEALSLAKRYRKVVIVAPDRQRLKEHNGIQFNLFPSGGIFSSIRYAYKKCLDIKADLYHIHEFEFLPLTLILRFKYRRKVIYDAHETIYYFFTEFSRRSKVLTIFPAIFAQLLEWFTSHFTDHVITVTPWVARGFKPFQKRISVIINYPVLDLFKVSSSKNSKKDLNIILYHGQLVPARNIETMVQAMSYVKQKFPFAKLLLVGSIIDWYHSKLESIIKKNSLHGVVEFRKRVPFERVPDLIKTAAIGLSSMSPNQSFKRSIQIKPFEFMAMGVPVLGCRVPSTEIYIEKSGAGVLVDPPTPKNLGEIIIDLLRNPEKINTMGKKGKEAVLKRYNWKIMEKHLFQIYREVLEC